MQNPSALPTKQRASLCLAPDSRRAVFLVICPPLHLHAPGALKQVDAYYSGQHDVEWMLILPTCSDSSYPVGKLVALQAGHIRTNSLLRQPSCWMTKCPSEIQHGARRIGWVEMSMQDDGKDLMFPVVATASAVLSSRTLFPHFRIYRKRPFCGGRRARRLLR